MGLLGGLLGTDRAARVQTRAAADANRIQKEQYDQTRKDLSGYRDMGTRGLDLMGREFNDLSRTFTMDDFQKDPGYQFRMDEAQKALERGAAARGGLMTGAHLKDLTRFGQNFASNEYQNAYNRFNQDRDQRFSKIQDLVGTGQNAATQTGQFGQNYASNYGQNVIGAGNAQAAASIAEGQALMSLLGQGAMAFSDRRLKMNIEQLPTSRYKDVPTYQFEYINPVYGNGPQVGVMAQDLLAIDANHPAVIRHQSGYYMVNYSML